MKGRQGVGNPYLNRAQTPSLRIRDRMSTRRKSVHRILIRGMSGMVSLSLTEPI